MRCKYLPQDLYARLHGGIGFYGGEPVFVHIEGDNQNKIVLYGFDGEVVKKEVKENDPLLDISSPELGYVNDDHGCFYVYRRPDRRYKQTLTTASLGVRSGDGSIFGSRDTDRLNDAFHGRYFRNMLMGKYPSVEKAFAKLSQSKKAASSIAIHRDVGLYRDSFGLIRVFFKGDEVGKINPGENIVRIPHDDKAWVISSYLNEFSWEID